jgi:hypothetical protein
MRCLLVLVVLAICPSACGEVTTANKTSSDSGMRADTGAGRDSGTGADTGAGTIGTTCSQDGVVVLACDEGLSCAAPSHGHDTHCCANASTPCHTDTDCCAGVCLTASGTCSNGASPGQVCTHGSDCVTGVCGPFGVCAALDAGVACMANAECASDLCTNGVCVCWPTGTPFPADASVENCCSQSEGLQPDGGQGCG